MLLTDEELDTKFGDKMYFARTVAKAQLKKVVDEGERLGVLNLTEEKGIALARTSLRISNWWQSLLKEVN